jgi:cell wall-associated NlpC family hydrolase
MKSEMLAGLLAELDVEPRHDLLELHEADGLLAGTAELRFLEQITEFCERGKLRNAVEFVTPQPAVVTRQVFLRAFASSRAPHVTEALAGDEVEILGAAVADQVRVRMKSDRYLGFVPRERLVSAPYQPTHTVTALRAHAYAGPRVQAPLVTAVSWGTQLRVRASEGGFSHVVLPDGADAFVHANLLVPGTPEGKPDVAASALEFLGVPYVWGGNSAWGLDCSGLVQLVYRMADVDLPRDADQQFAAGQRVDLADAQPGDAVCYRGHIGIYLADERMIHATGSAMLVREDHVFASEVLREAFLGVVRFQLP